MAKVNVKEVRLRVIKMNDAWRQGAAGAKFMNISQGDFQTEIAAAATEDQEIADLETQIKMKKVERDAKYDVLNKKSVKVREGVEGDPNFGPDSALYSAMGFIIESLRRSGLTRKKTPPPS